MNHATLEWLDVPGAVAYEITGRNVVTTNYVTIIVNGEVNQKNVFGLSPGQTYEWVIRSWCDANGVNTSTWSANNTFTTTTSQRLSALGNEDFSFELSQNLKVNYLAGGILVELALPVEQVQVFDVTGRELHAQIQQLSKTSFLLSLKGQSEGIYLLGLRSGGVFNSSRILWR